MSRHALVFVGGAEAGLESLASAGERALNGTFSPDRDGTLLMVIRDGKVAVNLSRHTFPDDPEDDFPSFAEHPFWFEVRDLDKNYGRQLEIARDLFFAIAGVGSLRTFLTDDLQTLEAVYTPEDGMKDWTP